MTRRWWMSAAREGCDVVIHGPFRSQLSATRLAAWWQAAGYSPAVWSSP